MSKSSPDLQLGTILDGEYEGTAFTFNLDLLRSGRLLLQASSGAGKSEAVRKLVTDTIPLLPSIIVDPEGEYAPLRKQLPFLLVGEGGEIPATLETVDDVVRMVLETGVSAIFDLFGLKKPKHLRKKGEPDLREVYAGRLFDALDDAPKNLWRDLMLVVDEAHVFGPQDVRRRAESPCAQPFAAMASRGRKRGVAVIAATQRIALLDNDICGLCENIMFGRTGLIDAPRTASLVGYTGGEARAFRKSIGNLNDGDFYAYGRAFGLQELTTMHVDRVPGPTLKQLGSRNGRQRSAPPPTPEALLALLPKFEALPKQVEVKSRTEADLRRELEASQKRERELDRALERALKSAPVVKAAPAPKIDKEKLRMLAKKLEELGKGLAAAKQAAEEQDERNARAAALLDELRKLLLPVGVGRSLAKATAAGMAALEVMPALMEQTPQTDEANGAGQVPGVERPAPLVSVNAPNAVQFQSNGNGGSLPGPERKILNVVAWLESSGIPDPANPLVAYLAGYSPSSSGYKDPRSALKTKGLLDYPAAGRVRSTEEGRRQAELPDVPATVESLQEAILAKLTGPEAKLLRILLRIYPEAIAHGDLAAEAGYSPTSSGFKDPRSALVTKGFAYYPAAGATAATSLLFPEL